VDCIRSVDHNDGMCTNRTEYSWGQRNRDVTADTNNPRLLKTELDGKKKPLYMKLDIREMKRIQSDLTPANAGIDDLRKTPELRFMHPCRAIRSISFQNRCCDHRYRPLRKKISALLSATSHGAPARIRTRVPATSRVWVPAGIPPRCSLSRGPGTQHRRACTGASIGLRISRLGLLCWWPRSHQSLPGDFVFEQRVYSNTPFLLVPRGTTSAETWIDSASRVATHPANIADIRS